MFYGFNDVEVLQVNNVMIKEGISSETIIVTDLYGFVRLYK